MRNFLVRALLALALVAAPSVTAMAQNSAKEANWAKTLEQAKGQEVFFYAWGGAPNINDYIAWVGEKVAKEYGVTLRHVRISDTAEAVTRVIAERTAGRTEGGSVDLIWINGENFASLKRQGFLLGGNWAENLPAYANVDVAGKPVVTSDFNVPVDGQESPWGLAQLTFYYDSAAVSAPPRTLEALAAWIAANPGRFTYAAPPDFIGSTFLKQVLYATTADPAVLAGDVANVDFDAETAGLWRFLDEIGPNLWRSGRIFAASTTQLKTLLGDGEIDIAMTFNPGEASSAIASGELPDTVRSFVLDYGSMGNAHFVTIPANASAKEGAMVVANFLLSPLAQSRKAKETVWGDPTVLDVGALAPEDKALFDALERGLATLSPTELGPALSEPHPSWTGALEAEWARRYSGG